jgi:hypothetical protein
MENEKDIKWWKSKTQNIFAIASLAFCFLVLLLLMFFDVPEPNRDVFNILAGSFFGGTIGSITGYLYGKSKPEGEMSSTIISSSENE